MTIPGHAPKRKNATQTHRVGPTQRDAGLERISKATKWTIAGGMIFTGGFVLVSPQVAASHSTHAASSGQEPVAAASVVAPPATVPVTVPPTVPVTVPPSVAPVNRVHQTPGAPTIHTATTVRPVVRIPQTTIPPQPAYQPPVRTYSPPVVASGGS